MNFFSFNFPLREYFFCTSPAPPAPHKFSNGPSLMMHVSVNGRVCVTSLRAWRDKTSSRQTDDA